MRRLPAAALFASILASIPASAPLAQQAPTFPRRGGNPEAAKVKSPVPHSTESVAAGRRLYTRWCASCHGNSGKGDGPGAASGGQPADLSDATWDYGSSDGEIFSVIHDGTSSNMGSYAERISEPDLWNVVNFIRSLGLDKKQPQFH